MADINNSGSNKRVKRSPKSHKDAALCDRKKNCWTAVENFVCNFRGDDSIRTAIKEKKKWDTRKELIQEADERLNDPLFILQKLRNSIEPSIMENTSFKKAFQEVELVLKQSKNPAPVRNYTDEMKNLEKDLQLSKEELKSIKEELMQQNAIVDLKKQLVTDARTFITVSRMLSKVVDKSCCITVPDIMNSENSVQEHFLQREDGQLILNFRPTPDSIQTNKSGKVDDIHNSKMIGQEELVLEVDLTLVFVGVRPEKLILKTQRGQKMQDASSESIGMEYFEKLLLNDAPLPIPGSSYAIGNAANMNLSSYERFIVSSTVQSYEVDKDNVEVLNRIFTENPGIDKEFKLKYSYFQSVFMNEIAKSYKSIESNPRIFETIDIRRMHEMVKDMELTGLELTSLKDMLDKVSQMLRNTLQEEKLKINQRLIELDEIDEATN